MKSTQYWAVLGGALFCMTVLPSVYSAGLKSATVRETKNEVVFKKATEEERSAVVGDLVMGSDVLRTGKKSRAELEFADKSIARLGSNTIFSFDASGRDMKLQQGTALIHVPPGLNGAKISTPAATAAIFGDVIAMRVNDQGATQIVALSRDAQGPVTVTFHKTGETQKLEPGQMLSIDPAMVKMPPVMDISVEVFTQSCPLTKSENSEFKAPLPPSATHEMKQAQGIQQKEIRSGALENSGNVVVMPHPGASIQVVNVDNNVLVQAAATGQFVGRYRGIGVNSGGSVDNFIMIVAPDGRMVANIQKAGGGTSLFQGSIGNDGSFSGVSTSSNGGGGSSNGVIKINNGNFTGVVSSSDGGPPTVLSGSKQ